VAGTPGGLTASIRGKLQDGKTAEAIVQDMVATGMTQASAQRFVDRALAEEWTPAPPGGALPADGYVIPASQRAVERDTYSPGRAQLAVASILMCGGIATAGASYVMAWPDRVYLISGLIAIVLGFLGWAHALVYGIRNPRDFEWYPATSSIVTASLLAAVVLSLGQRVPPPEDEETPSPAMANVPLKEDGTPTVTVNSTWLPTDGGATIDSLLADFDSPTVRGAVRCDIARAIARVPADQKAQAITGMMNRYADAHPSVQTCIRDSVSILDPTVRFPEPVR
jgi:hypothetical protein